jgi:adenosylmethionine-8-amino-7-oxononanoate aminotransferase
MRPKTEYLETRLKRDFCPLVHVADVRRWGFMVGIEAVEDKATLGSYPPEKRVGHRIILEARKRGVIVRPLGNVIVLMPPLTIAQAELQFLLDAVYESIRVVTES